MAITVDICNRNNLCVDCDNKECWHCGDKIADCPRYPQYCAREKIADSCDDCTWIDKYIEEIRCQK